MATQTSKGNTSATAPQTVTVLPAKTAVQVQAGQLCNCGGVVFASPIAGTVQGCNPNLKWPGNPTGCIGAVHAAGGAPPAGGVVLFTAHTNAQGATYYKVWPYSAGSVAPAPKG